MDVPNRESLSPEMQKAIAETEAEEAQNQQGNEAKTEEPKKEEKPQASEEESEDNSEGKSEEKTEESPEDKGKIDNSKQEKEENKEHKTRYIPLSKLQNQKEKSRKALADLEEKLNKMQEENTNLAKKVAELENMDLTKKEKADELEELAEKYEVPLEFLKAQEKIFSKRLGQTQKEDSKQEEKKEPEAPRLTPEEQRILLKAKEDEGFDKDFSTSKDNLPETDQELFDKNRKLIKELAYDQKNVKRSLVDIFYTQVKPEITGESTTEAGGKRLAVQKDIRNVTDVDIDNMDGKQFREYMEGLKQLSPK